MSIKSTYDFSSMPHKITVTDDYIQDNPALGQMLNILQQQQTTPSGQGTPSMGMGGSRATAVPTFGPSISAMAGGGPTASPDKSVPEALERDLKSQGVEEDIDINRLSRVVIRALRALDDEVFEAAGVNPKYHRENFTKVIDQIMKGL